MILALTMAKPFPDGRILPVVASRASDGGSLGPSPAPDRASSAILARLRACDAHVASEAGALLRQFRVRLEGSITAREIDKLVIDLLTRLALGLILVIVFGCAHTPGWHLESYVQCDVRDRDGWDLCPLVTCQVNDTTHTVRRCM